jgi:uncharacterized iron-regulated membrane protein
MTVKKLFGKLHLWFGLASGLVVFIVCITAAIWAFSPEIEEWTQPYRHVAKQEKPFLPVTQLQQIAEKQMPGKKTNRVIFNGNDKSAVADFYGEGYYYTIFMNPYNGTVLKKKDNRGDFFGVVITGHYTLWLGEVGGQIVKWGTLIFLIMLITGIVLWWPRNKAARKQRFSIKLKASPKRLNYDLHNVLGFYASWILVCAALTGLVWTFDWLRSAEYWLGSGGKTMPEYPEPLSIKNEKETLVLNGIDSVFAVNLAQYNNPYYAAVGFPSGDSASYNISIYPKKRYYDGDDYYFNQYTLQEIPVNFYGQYKNANGGERLSRMNYDIHIGNILGLPGRIAMFLAVLIGASLPITGFYIWWGRNKANKKKTKKEDRKSVIENYFAKKRLSKVKVDEQGIKNLS